MCHRVQCPKCNKPTWAGCGNHIDSALAGVPLDERCHCKKWTNAGAGGAPAGGGDGCKAQ
jgi:hypothetical protein